VISFLINACRGIDRRFLLSSNGVALTRGRSMSSPDGVDLGMHPKKKICRIRICASLHTRFINKSNFSIPHHLGETHA
jgi:hypothetical protein